MDQRKKDLWSFALHEPHIDPAGLTTAIENQIANDDLDYRSRLLIRDSVDALEQYWGQERLHVWLRASPYQDRIRTIRHEAFERVGFPFLRRQLVETLSRQGIEDLFQEIAGNIRKRVVLHVGGSIALIVPGLLQRRTQDVDIVDEVPKEIRDLGRKLKEIENRHRLKVAHFQSRYLPMRWEQRVHSLNAFGSLQVYLVDPGDVFLSKLFSLRDKDLDDLHILKAKIDKTAIARRMSADMQSYLSNDTMRERAEQNWYILYGEKLPYEQQPPSQPAPSA